MLNTAIAAARAAGAIIRDGYGNLREHEVALKGKGDFVTEVDHASEEAVISIIREQFPAHSILAEESGARPGSGVCWVIDPLDGTSNFVHSIPVFGVSIGCLKDNELVCGVIYNPVTEELFTAEKGGGAFLNSRPIAVNSDKQIGEAFLATGFPWRQADLVPSYLKGLETLLMQGGGVRRLGAAAIDLAYTACGIFDGFWEMKLKPWDMAAGALIVREAGGLVSDFSGEDRFLDTGSIVAGSPSVFRQILERLPSDG